MSLLHRDNTDWRAQQARPVAQRALPAGTGAEQAGDRYAAMLAGA